MGESSTRRILLFCINVVIANEPLKDIANCINIERQEHKLSKLRHNAKLEKAAQSQADWMASVGQMKHLRGQQAKSFEEWKKSDHHTVNRMIHAEYFKWDELFSLEVQNGKQVLIAKPGVNDHVGEIIAQGVAESGPGRFQPAVIVAGWMNSPSHKKSILTASYEEFGVGFAKTKRGDVYWCVVFGSSIRQ